MPDPIVEDAPQKCILVPVQVDAFFYGPQCYSSLHDGNAPVDPEELKNWATIAHVPPPNHQSLVLDGDIVSHDVFEHINLHPNDLNNQFIAPRFNCSYGFSNDNFKTDRTGIYLHWSLPKVYRTGIAATSSAADSHQDRMLQQGFPSQAKLSSQPANIPIFRPVPDRWIIIRRLHKSWEDDMYPNGSLRDLAHVPGHPEQTQSYEGLSLVPLYKTFVVDSNVVRHIEDFNLNEDLTTSASPYVDPTIPLAQQGQMFIGRTVSLPGLDNGITARTVPLTVATTGNPYFADFQPHNANVFSFFDDLVSAPRDFSYEDGRLTWIFRGTLSYTIFGYHSSFDMDPLTILPSTPAPVPTHEERLDTCFMALKDMNTGLTNDDRSWFQSSQGAQMRTICHGNVISINVAPDTLPSPANDAQKILTTSHPIAVGTNAMDALLGWMRANNGSVVPGRPNALAALASDDLTTIENQLLKLQVLVQSVDDDLDSQLEAADLIATNNFSRKPGGTTWNLKKPSSGVTNAQQPTISPDDVHTLRQMNLCQNLLNGYIREVAQLKLKLFEEWWTYVGDRNRGSDAEKNQRKATARTKVTTIVERLTNLGGLDVAGTLVSNLQSKITQLAGSIKCESGVREPFFTQRDPTLLIAGVPPGRDTKLAGKPLPVRISGQETVGLDPATTNDPDLASWFDNIDRLIKLDISQAIPQHSLQAPVIQLLKETPYLSKRKPGAVPPYGFLNDGVWAGQQAWCPLFFEWTAEYYHIPKEQWNFVPQGPESKIQFGIKPNVNLSTLPGIQDDFIVISGRSPVLSQVSSSLQTTLKQLFAQMDPDELNQINEDQRNQLLADVADLQYVSANMDGFTDYLLTRARGMHVQPNDAQTGKPLPEALEIGAEIGFTTDSMSLMDYGAPYTPFASLVDVPADPSKVSPFKPCIHGQFRFTKLQLVDKFGQVVTPSNVFDPDKPWPIFPCLGQTYSLDAIANGSANAVLSRNDNMSPFVQLPPSINQPARVNGDFVTFGKHGWRPLDEWENPVCGWIVVNFPDFSLQVFDDSGHFIREFQLIGGTSYHPFKPVDLKSTVDPLLRSLMSKWQDQDYLKGMFDTISAAVESFKHPPTEYAESILSILGRPLALVKMGFSLELAEAPLTNMSTLSPNLDVAEASVTDYIFPMKVGDADNVFDGLVGYFKLQEQTKSTPSSEFDMSSFFSYFAASTVPTGNLSKQISSPLPMQPYWIQPTDDPVAYAAAHNSQRHVIAALIDPFVPVHAYTQLLPLKLLSLPSWVISSGISRVSTFFRMGPLLLSSDVPAFDSTKVVAHDYTLDEQNKPTMTGKIAVPTFPQADWVWLQPYLDSKMPDTAYNFVDLESLPAAPTFPPIPYTAVEGYLQMKKPFGPKEDVPAKEE
jgi:hypothetical protein